MVSDAASLAQQPLSLPVALQTAESLHLPPREYTQAKRCYCNILCLIVLLHCKLGQCMLHAGPGAAPLQQQ
jgi:hypothetical protein